MSPDKSYEDETPTIDQRLYDVGKLIAQLTAIRAAAESLLEQVDINGSMIHSGRCGCDDCEAISLLRRLLAETEGGA